MKYTKSIFSLVLLFLSIQTFSQILSPKWESCFGGSGWDEGTGMLYSDSTYWIVSNTNSTNGDISYNHGTYDYWFLNIDYNGNLISEKTFGGQNADGGFIDIKQLNNSKFYISASSSSTDGDISNNPWPGANGNLWVLQINKQGDILWETMAGGSGTDELRDMKVTDDGGVLLLALTSSHDGDITDHYGSWDLWLIKIESSGQKQWSKSFGGTGIEGGGSVILTSDGGYMIAGYTDGYGGGNYDTTCNHHNPGSGFIDAWLVKLDSLHNIEWQQCYGGYYDDAAFNAIETTDGYVVVGYTLSNDGDVSGLHGPPGPNSEYGGDIWVFKIDFQGNLLWQKCLGGTYNDFARNIFPTSDGGFMVVGSTASDDGDVEGYHGIDTGIYDDVWLVKLDSLGNLTYQYCYGGGGRETIYRGVVQKDDFNYVITLGTDTDEWQCRGASNWAPDLRVVELYDSTVGVDETVENKVEVRVFPNPASNTIHLRTKAGEGKVVVVFDVFGKQILKTAMPGNGEQQIDVSSWPAGLYLVSLFEKGRFVKSQKIIIK